MSQNEKQNLNQINSVTKKKKKTLSKQLNDTVSKTKKAMHQVADHKKTKAAIDWSKKTSAELKDQALELGRDVMSSDMGKAAAKGAAVGAVAAVPIPLVGPFAGAVVGAGVGVYLHHKFKHDGKEAGSGSNHSAESVIEQLNKLELLRASGVLTETEFQEQKKKLLKRI